MALPDNLQYDAPVPGQSWTESPDSPRDWESPPEYTNLEEAQTYMFEMLTSEDFMPELVDLLAQGVPIETLASGLAFNGFAHGKWTPDLMLLLLEPIVYILLYVSEVTGTDYVLSFDEEDYMEADDMQGVDRKLETAKKPNPLADGVKQAINKAEGMDMSEIPSLLGKGEME